MSDTSFDAEGLRKSARNIGKLLNDMDAFDTIKGQHPDAGSFATAQWLERMVDDRRNGLVSHAAHLKTIFKKLESSLKSIADSMEDADRGNAEKIAKSLEGDLVGKITADDAKTEKRQHNFSGGKNDPDDGNGYDDSFNRN
ncbi:hypothetical protein DMC64_37170 [Amycolatopsis sp. WAC 04197]|uniref:hypothetical protein n=1 Tax=Amycolatopsis sp. WAC 04197 TaxID=2203199 RepID=UPI000F785B7F|nr:hypothetical protein [Amycolatopsis sp. WAC 04197]RSN39702.1 hypothetical protein DMC64_37170 [Amycolatopsis sp. WAC 04197]